MEKASAKIKILLVDDEEFICDLGRRILEGAGFEVVTASNGKEALEVYERDRSNIALVVLDLMMPQMTGEKCLPELVKIDPKVKVIISTGRSPEELDHLPIKYLARGFVNKPYRAEQMLKTVGDAL